MPTDTTSCALSGGMTDFNYYYIVKDKHDDSTIETSWCNILKGNRTQDFKTLCNICALHRLYISDLYENKKEFCRDFPKEGFHKSPKWHVRGDYAFRDFIPIRLKFPGHNKAKYAAISFNLMEGMVTDQISFIDNGINYNIGIKLLLLSLLNPIKYKICFINSNRHNKYNSILKDARTILDTFVGKEWKEITNDNIFQLVGSTAGFVSIDDKVFGMMKSLYDIKLVSVSFMRGYRRRISIKKQYDMDDQYQLWKQMSGNAWSPSTYKTIYTPTTTSVGTYTFPVGTTTNKIGYTIDTSTSATPLTSSWTIYSDDISSSK